MKTKTATPPKYSEQLKAAKKIMAAYIKLKKKKSDITIAQGVALAALHKFAVDNKGKFDEDYNFKLPGGYLHFGNKTIIVPCEGFSMAQFVTEFPELVDKKFKTAPMKALLQSEEGKAKLLANHCVELKTEEDFEVVVK